MTGTAPASIVRSLSIGAGLGWAFLASLLSGCGAPTALPPSVPAVPRCPTVGPEQMARLRAVTGEINLARTQPRHYANLLAQVYADMAQDGTLPRGATRIRTAEGRKAVDEAIGFLRQATPQAALALDVCLSWAAQDHAADLARSGRITHTGSDGSQPSDRAARRLGAKAHCGENLDFGSESPREHVASLIVDDNVTSRGHRTNLFRPEYRSVGVGIGPHPTYGHVTVQLLCLEFPARG